ncbi:MAG: hypothetical protein GX577_16425 [Leptolinea sp.]|nr:hypothetical protein [Leptolinea sp.]
MPGQLMLVFLSGLISGLFVNYLADVLPRSRRFTEPVCLSCGQFRTWKEFALGKPCAACGRKNSVRFWIVIILEIILAGLVWFFPLGNFPFWASELFLLVFSVMIVTDIEFRVILEQVTIAGYILSFFAGLFLHGLNKTILGGISGFLLFLALYYFGRLFARRLAHNREEPIDEEALGFGDVHLAGVVGLLTGFPFNLTAMLLAIILGGIASIVIIVITLVRKQYQAFMAIPYGPFIIIGGIAALYYYL